MGDIYRGSLCTIMALQSASAEGGCFTIRNPLQKRPCFLNSDLSISNPQSASDRTRMHNMALLSRGWVVQERVLSSRTLYYDTDQILWECVTANASELHPWMDVEEHAINPKQAFVSLSAHIKPRKKPPGRYIYADSWDFYEAWTGLLNYYTSCQHTRASDRLIAFEGMIAIVSQATGLRSHAGLWREMLPRELLWYASVDNLPVSKSLRLPTWSWMSIDSPVTNNVVALRRHGYDLRTEMKLQRSVRRPKRTKTGQFWQANLQLRAPMVTFGKACQLAFTLRDRTVEETPKASDKL